MKRIPAIILLSVAVCFFSCKKDKATEKTTPEKISGKWNVVSIYEIVHTSGVSDTTTAIVNPTNYYWDFQSGNTLVVTSNGASAINSYGVLNASQLWITTTTAVYDITTLTDTDLVIYEKTSGTDYYEFKGTFKKQ